MLFFFIHFLDTSWKFVAFLWDMWIRNPEIIRFGIYFFSFVAREISESQIEKCVRGWLRWSRSRVLAAFRSETIRICGHANLSGWNCANIWVTTKPVCRISSVTICRETRTSRCRRSPRWSSTAAAPSCSSSSAPCTSRCARRRCRFRLVPAGASASPCRRDAFPFCRDSVSPGRAHSSAPSSRWRTTTSTCAWRARARRTVPLRRWRLPWLDTHPRGTTST